MSVGVGDEARLYSPRLKLTAGDRFRLYRKTTQWTPDRPKKISGQFANKRDRIGKMLTRATRDLSATTNTPQGFKNTSQYGGNAENFAAEVSGSTFRSAEISFYIDDDALILDAQLRFVVTGYRTYERDTAGGGGGTETSEEEQLHQHEWAYGASGSGADTIRKYTSISSTGTANVYLDVSTSDDLLTRVPTTGHSHDIVIASHSHAQVYDIFESTSAPGAITVKLDGVSINNLIFGPFTVVLGQVVDVSLTGILTNPGWHTLRLETASGKGRVTPYILVRSLQLQP